MGFDGIKARYFINSLASQPQFDFASLTAFATDLSSTTQKDYTLLTQSLGLPVQHFPLGELAAYAQDTWRASAKLTVMFGLRWDKPTPPKAPQTNTAYFQTGTIPKPDLQLAPRAGVAYQLNDKTAVRFGYGFYYAPATGQLMDALYTGNALSQANLAIGPGLIGAPTFPAGLPPSSTLPSSSVVTSLPVCNYGICTVSGSGSGSIPSGAEEVMSRLTNCPILITSRSALPWSAA